MCYLTDLDSVGLRWTQHSVKLVRMKLQLRSFAALLALIALSIFLVEGVWASTCAPGMGMEAGAVASMGGAGSQAECPDAVLESPASGGQHDQPAAPDCPLALAAGSCAVAATLPAHAPETLVPLPEGALLTISPDYMRDLLLVSALFHPPRA
ncbi:hypothetical protein BH24GEM2_BH24GEM2_14950 [soil metagenome]